MNKKNALRMCAERRLIASYVRKAQESGVSRAATACWVKRRIGVVDVVRLQANGERANSTPCALCVASLSLFDLHVTFHDGGTVVTRRAREML